MRLSELIEEIRRKDAILCLSVQHTGTWFVLNFLFKHKDTKGEVVQVKDVTSLDDITENGIVHVHISGIGIGSKNGLKTKTFERTVYLTKGMRLIVPVRDPLLSLITRHKRHPEKSHHCIIDGFAKMHKLDATFLPIDTDAHPYYLLENVCKELGLKVDEYVEDWSVKWPVYNSKFDYSLKRAYQKGKIDKIASAFPLEYQHLKENEKNIRPFLKKMGYKNLMWWT